MFRISAALASLLAPLATLSASAQLQVEFVASSPAHEHAARAYRAIWEQDGARILSALETQTCMKFQEPVVKALVADDVSHSGGPDHPMGLRASYDLDVKRATLVHELGHRHLWQLVQRLDDVDGHRTLYLILDRVWAEVWGEDFAAARVRGEAAWRASYDYAAAWQWARAMTLDQRGVLWNRLLALNAKSYCYSVYVTPRTAANAERPGAVAP